MTYYNNWYPSVTANDWIGLFLLIGIFVGAGLFINGQMNDLLPMRKRDQ